MLSVLVLAACSHPGESSPSTSSPGTSSPSLSCVGGESAPGPDRVEWVDAITGGPTDVSTAAVAATTTATADGDVVVVTATRGALDVAGTKVQAPDHGTAISRFGPDGEVRWARVLHASDPATPEPYGDYAPPTERMQVGSAPDGSLYAAGTVYGSVRFAPDTPDEIDVPGVYDPETSHGVLAKLDGDGAPAWVVDLVGHAAKPFQPQVDIWSVAGMGDGGVVIAGSREGALTLGAGEPGEVQLPDEHQGGTFVARYRADGTLLWAWDGPVGWGGPVAAAGDRIRVAWWYTEETSLDNGDVLPGPAGAAVIALDDSGKVIWSDTMSAPHVFPIALAMTTDGGVGLAGVYGSEDGGDLVLSPGTPQETHFAVVGFDEVLLAKWDASGVLAWARSGRVAEPYFDAEASGLAPTDDGGVEVTGYSSKDLILDDGTATTTVPHASQVFQPYAFQLEDLWYARYGSDGTLVHAAMVGGAQEDFGAGVAWGAGGPVVIGSMVGGTTFGLCRAADALFDFPDGGVAVVGLSP